MQHSIKFDMKYLFTRAMYAQSRRLNIYTRHEDLETWNGDRNDG